MPETGTAFRKLDARSVVGIFKSTGARDPDELHAQKQRLLAQPKQYKLLSMICVVVGAFFTITVILAIAGIPFMLFGIWMWFYSKRQMAVIEEGYAEFAASLVSPAQAAMPSVPRSADARSAAPLR